MTQGVGGHQGNLEKGDTQVKGVDQSSLAHSASFGKVGGSKIGDFIKTKKGQEIIKREEDTFPFMIHLFKENTNKNTFRGKLNGNKKWAKKNPK